MPSLQVAVTLSIAISLVYLAAVAVAGVAGALRAGGRRDDRADGDEALSMSRFTIPVSLIVPASAAATASLSTVIDAALALNYPEFEVIVVVEGAARGRLDAVVHDWQLVAKEFFYRRTIDTAPVHRIHRSLRDPRLMVIDKGPAGYGDALNCGVNLARYRYVVSLSPDVAFDSNALLRLMSSAVRDPANVLGASNHVEDGAPFPRLASARAQMESRLVWKHLPGGLGPKSGVATWRRDALLRLGGFSTSAADPELEMMFRLQALETDGTGHFKRGTDVFGQAGRRGMIDILRQSGRNQRAVLGLLGASLKGTGGLAPGTLAYFVFSEVLTPLAQAWIIAATTAGAGAGWFPWSSVILTVVLLSFGNAALSVGALLLRGAGPGAPRTTELRRLLVAAPLEFVLVRPALAGARLLGALSFGPRRT